MSSASSERCRSDIIPSAGARRDGSSAVASASTTSVFVDRNSSRE